ncbi:MAG: CvpA family protein [Eubacteriales bacterium]|nr:CvpA family protein [Eubacteriales bacterium]
MNILDILIILVFIGCLVYGYFKGAFKEIFDILGFVLGIILFRIISPFINNWFLQSSFYEKIKEWIVIDLKFSSLFETVDIDLSNPANIEALNVPNFIKEQLVKFNNAEVFASLNANNSSDYITGFIATTIVSLISLFFIILLTSIIISIILRFTKVLSKLPVLSKINKIGGVALGVINGILTLWLLGLIVLILVLFPPFSWLKEMLNNSAIASPVFENNYLIDFLMYLISIVLK